MIGRRILRVLRGITIGLSIFLVVVIVATVLLRLFNPRPVDASVGWAGLAPMPDPRGEVAAAAIGTRLVVAGGLRGVGTTSDAVSVYDIAKDGWARGKPLPEPRHHAAGASIEGRIYVSGGASGATDWTPRDNLWRARPGGAWEIEAVMPEGRQGHAMVTWGGRLYVIGGMGDTDRTLIYHPDEGWSTGAPLPAGRDHLRAVAWGNEIWAIGGRDTDPSKRVDIYSPRADRWRRGPDLPDPMSAMAVAVLSDELHVIGGEDPDFIGGGVSAAHAVWPKEERRWGISSRPLLPVHGAAFAVNQERLIIAGGASRQGALSVISWTPVTQSYWKAYLQVSQ